MKKITLLGLILWISILAWCGNQMNHKESDKSSSSSEIMSSSESNVDMEESSSSEESSEISEESSSMTWDTSLNMSWTWVEIKNNGATITVDWNDSNLNVWNEAWSISQGTDWSLQMNSAEWKVTVWADWTVKIWE